MKLKVHMSVVKKVKFLFPEFELDTEDYPELEGRTLDDIRQYLEKHTPHLHPLHAGFDNLFEELEPRIQTVVLEEFPAESRFYVKTEEEMARE